MTSPVVAVASPIAEPGAAPPVTFTVRAGQPVRLTCLDDHVQLSADADALPEGSVIRCERVPSVPQAPPGQVVDNILFRVSVESEDTRETLPLRVQIAYAAAAVPSDQRGDLVIGYFDERTWSPVAEQTVEQAVSRVSGT
ncbi:MAG: hypothetical protein AB7P40_28155, partial [Chloroflexota bacterium]